MRQAAYVALAKQWGVHPRTIEKILSYETARHVP